MKVRSYRELQLAAEVSQRGDMGVEAFEVRVLRSPAGECGAQSRTLPQDLPRTLGRLDRRRLDVAGIVELGETLADLLLPEAARALFVRSLDRLGAGEGLRLRLQLPPELSGIPWEYMYVARGEGEKDATGFLALDPRISIVRHERLSVAAEASAARTRRLLVALSNPASDAYPALDLARERSVIEAAVADLPGLGSHTLESTTAPALADALAEGADIFHFAGHGVFEQTGLGVKMGSVVGRGAVVLVGEDGGASLLPADQLAVNLRGQGVQLVVLGACETGRRDDENVWSGVVAALMEAGIPAVVAMQFTVWDDAAIAFARALYRGMAAGLTLDQAVSAGRLQVFNLCHPRNDGFWREWGVPVLYQRGEGEVRLPAEMEDRDREAIQDELSVVAELRVKQIGPRATYVGVEAGTIEGGRIQSTLEAEKSEGQATLVSAERVEGGSIDAKAQVDDLAGGKLTGVKLGSIGKPTKPEEMQAGDEGTATAATGPAAAPDAIPVPNTANCGNCHAPLPDGAKFCGQCGTPVPEAAAGPKFCSQCGGELAAGAKFCGACGARVGLG